ncbi:MAG: hypothetical protein ACI87W_000815 [Halieaceae bacterium]|jgi:hypothetical protein
MPELSDTDTRTPSPPYGYSRPCALSREEQTAVVARFHANQIRPNRIAYRMGIDIAIIEALIAGELESQRFTALLGRYRKQRYRDRMRESGSGSGSGRYDQQQQIEKDFQQEVAVPAAPSHP